MCLGLPLRTGGYGIGYCVLSADRPARFTDDERRLFESPSPQIAVAVQNSQLLDATRRKAEREKFCAITAKVRNTADVESVMRTAVTEIGCVLNRKTFLFERHDDDTGEHSRPEQNP